MRGRSNRLRISLDHLYLSISIISLSKLSRRKAILSPSVSLIGLRRYLSSVSVGISHRRRLFRWLLLATSPSVVLLEATELSLGGSFEIESLLFVGSVSWWFFSSKLFLDGSNRSSHLKSKDRRIKVHRAKVHLAQEFTAK
ncbi:hypothetical protein F2Q69_00011821 [Brassica cretica]|uniref:Uncharacterized protein n=1 Tax=Brassica cretica TaxID=69181 RepID=A0A8S9QY14_BRACR|nr:hypothetical protein F2Q69_00011821 [Brassica cretica]